MNYPLGTSESDPDAPWNIEEHCAICDAILPSNGDGCTECDPLGFAKDLLYRLLDCSHDLDRLEDYLQLEGDITIPWTSVIRHIREAVEELGNDNT